MKKDATTVRADGAPPLAADPPIRLVRVGGSVPVDPAPGTVMVRLLGAPEWTVDGTPVAISDARAAVLIAMVALDGPLPRMQAAEMFWPHAKGTGRANLRVLLHRLQHATGTKVFGTGERLALLPHVQVDLAGTDADIVERCVTSGASTARLLSGIDLGDLPEASRWLSGARGQMEQRLLQGHIAWLEAHPDATDLPRANAVAESLIALDPLCEIGHRELMRVRVQRGDRAGALAAFERCKRELREHLGASPDPKTTALHREILRVRDLDTAHGFPGSPPPSRRPLLQREHELADMDKAFAARRVVIVEGPSGAGKTALLMQFARQRNGFYWAAEPADANGALAGLVRLTAHVAALMSPDGGPSPVNDALALLKRLQQLEPEHIIGSRLADGVASVSGVLQRAGYRSVLIDDVHLLDDVSLDVLSRVMHAGWDLMPWCDFVLAYRPMRARRKVRALCEKLAMDGHLRLIHPSALKREAVLQLLAGQPGIDLRQMEAADRLVALSGGTPGVLVELVELGVSLTPAGDLVSLPPQVRSILLERLRSCSSTADGLAQLASVAGSSFSVELAATIAGLSSWKVAEKWNELLLAGVFNARGFAFPLMELAVRESVPDAVRQFMHGEVAKALERQGAGPERLAYHWRQAGDSARAVQHGRAAAAACLQAGQLAGAIDALETAVAIPNGVQGEGHAVALLQLAALCLQADRLDRVTELLEAAARSQSTGLERGVCTALGGRTLLAMGEHAAARTALLSALPMLVESPSLHRAVACWARLASQRAGDPADDDAITSLDDLPKAWVWDADMAQVQTPEDGRRCVEALQRGPTT